MENISLITGTGWEHDCTENEHNFRGTIVCKCGRFYLEQVGGKLHLREIGRDMAGNSGVAEDLYRLWKRARDETEVAMQELEDARRKYRESEEALRKCKGARDAYVSAFWHVAGHSVFEERAKREKEKKNE